MLLKEKKKNVVSYIKTSHAYNAKCHWITNGKR